MIPAYLSTYVCGVIAKRAGEGLYRGFISTLRYVMLCPL